MVFFNNPNKASFPAAVNPAHLRNQLGYRTYVQFMMDWGRDRSPEIDNAVNANPTLTGKTPLSLLSPDCPLHSESTAGGNFLFPPRSQPMHSVRRALIAAIQLVKERNTLVSSGAADRVAIVTYDGSGKYHWTDILQPLTEDYNQAMQSCTTLQATADLAATTSTESGVAVARQHLMPKTAASNPANDPRGAQGRRFATQVIILLTDGMPNAWEMPPAEMDTYIADNTSDSFYPVGYDWFNSVLVQTHQFQDTQRGKLFGVGMGLGADYDFMDRISRIASTDLNGQSLRGSANPAEFEESLIDMLTDIIDRAGSRLVE